MKTHISLFFFSALTCFQLQAGGIQLQFQSAQTAGMGHIGYGKYWGASSLYYNPAAAAMAYRHEIEMGMGFVQAFTTYSGEYPSVYSSTMKARAQSPFYLYALFRPQAEQKWTAGLAINSPFGNATRWDENWNGRFLTQISDLSVLNVQPTFAYRLNENLAIGGGMNVYLSTLFQQRAIPIGTNNNLEGKANLNAKGWGLGGNIGLLIRPAERFSIGINYRTAARIRYTKGDAVFDVPQGFRRNYPNSKFETSLYLPAVLSLGIAFHPSEREVYELDVSLNNWRKTDSIPIFYENTQLKDEKTFKNFRNAYTVKLGREQRITDFLRWRVGAYYDVSPIRNEFVSPDLPDANRIGITTGFGFRWQKWQLNLSGEYQFTGERAFLYKAGNFAGYYNLNAFSVGLGAKYAF
ncbi:MAG: OmpP1/FadL family transporter [Bacteroidia bacterium]